MIALKGCDAFLPTIVSPSASRTADANPGHRPADDGGLPAVNDPPFIKGAVDALASGRADGAVIVRYVGLVLLVALLTFFSVMPGGS